MDFRDLLNSLLPKAAKWNSLGIQLGLSTDELDIIRANSMDVEECLRKVLQRWHDKTLNPTWQEIVTALKAMDEARFAKELEVTKISGSDKRESPKPDDDDKRSAGIIKEIKAKINGSFATLVRKVTGKLAKRDINMKDFRLYVVNLFPPGDIITDVVSVADIFEIVSRHQLWDYTHYTPIEEVAGEFGGDDPELRGWISDYKAELAGFKAMTKIMDYIKVCDDDEDIADSEQTIRQNMARYDKRYCRKLTIKLKARVTEKSLCYIDEFWRSIADHFFLPCLSVLLDTIQEGCVEVTWCVPTLSALHIQANIQDSTEFLQQSGVVRVIMDDEILYDEEGMDTKLLKACEKGEMDEVVALLTYGIDVDTADPKEDGSTPLLVAARKGNRGVIELLLNYNASIDKGDFVREGYTPLLVAALNGHLLAVQILLEHHADTNLSTKDGWTALSCACYKGHLEMVKVLLLHNADVNAHSKTSWTPLMHAIELKEENVEMVKLLLDAGAVINHGKDSSQTAWCPLALACDNGYFNIVKLLIERGADIDILGEDSQGFEWTPLIMAANRGHYQICELLLELGSAVDLPQKGGATPLIMACRNGTPELISLLMKHGASVHAQCKNGVTAMHVVCNEGHLDMVKVLHAQGASIETASEKGCTPLMSACSGGHVDVAEYLVEQNSSLLNYRTQTGWSPLMFACDEGHSALVARLLSLGSNIEDITCESGLSALIVATDKGHLETVKLLLEAKAHVNYTEKSAGWSAMFFAAKKGHLAIVKLLLEYEADMWLKAKSADVTAYDVASIEGHTEVCDELEAHGYQSLAPPTEIMRREVERSNMILPRNILDVENIRTFRNVLHHGYRHAEERRFGSNNSNATHPSWEPDM